MPPSPAAEPTQIDPNNPFTRDLLRSLAATVRAQPNETPAEYAERFAAVTTAWAAHRPRDPMEQLLAAQIVAAHYAALDCLNKAADTEDPAQAGRQTRFYATLTRTIQNMIRLLADQQRRPAIAAQPMPAIEPIPPLRRRPAEPITTKQPMHRDKAPAAQDEDPTKMTDDELQSGLPEMRTQAAMALFDTKHPMHREALRMLPQILPGIVVPDAMLEDPLPMAA
jgi:hypothetical protein